MTWIAAILGSLGGVLKAIGGTIKKRPWIIAIALLAFWNWRLHGSENDALDNLRDAQIELSQHRQAADHCSAETKRWKDAADEAQTQADLAAASAAKIAAEAHTRVARIIRADVPKDCPEAIKWLVQTGKESDARWRQP